jgi:V8-like Glu-specific endopeptidase
MSRAQSMRPKSVPPVAFAMAASLASGLGTGCSEPTRMPIRLAGIAQEVESQPRPSAFSPALELAEQQDAIVRVLGDGGACTGTLIASDLVLTAHHCVVSRATRESRTYSLTPAKDLSIELGGDYLAWGTVGVKHVVVPPCGHRGGEGDLAILVLDRKLLGVPTMRARLTQEPQIGEPVDAVGFGLCATSEGIKRRPRAGGPIRALTGGTVEVSAAICPGDSGGPVLARGTNEVLAVVSMSQMDGSEKTLGLSVMSRLDSFRPLFAQARMIAEGAHPQELPPLSCP